MHMFGYGYPGTWNWGWGIGMFLMMLLWIAVITAAIILIAKYLRKDSNSSSSAGKALEILDIKLAQGEISEAEYMQRKKILNEK